MSSRSSPERDVQVAIVAWLRLVLPAGSKVAAVKNEHAPRAVSVGARMRFFAKRREEGVLAGFPDIVILLAGGKTVLFETKRPKNGVVSETQGILHGELTEIGHPVYLVTSIEDGRGVLVRLSVPLREAAGQLTSVARVRVAKPKRTLST